MRFSDPELIFGGQERRHGRPDDGGAHYTRLWDARARPGELRVVQIDCTPMF